MIKEKSFQERDVEFNLSEICNWYLLIKSTVHVFWKAST